MIRKICLAVVIGSFLTNNASAQTSTVNLQLFGAKTENIRGKLEDTLQKQFAERGLKWPAKYLYIRSFKYDKQLELWVKNDWNEPFKLFKNYKVCLTSGTIGPKRKEGDKQVPEGFYYINEFNPNSNYHMALGLNYPNPSDRVLADASRPGGDIYIHGSCVSIGCIPLMDDMIEEVYVMAAASKAQGQDFIPVHVFPVNFRVKKSFDYLKKYTATSNYASMVSQLKNAFYYFEDKHQLPLVLFDNKGDYIVDAPEAKDNFYPDAPAMVRRDLATEFGVVDNADRLPMYKTGTPAFNLFLNKLIKEMIPLLPYGIQKVYLKLEFVVDKEGNTIYAEVVQGGMKKINEKVIDHFLKECKWTPAMKDGQPVVSKLVQSLTVERPEED
ncbi:MAG: L,D-transpeptidase family protein [Sphingobacteriales bacterium]|nr:L,D-transpeptidase family protein [Sphingobacteriales bacterium]